MLTKIKNLIKIGNNQEALASLQQMNFSSEDDASVLNIYLEIYLNLNLLNEAKSTLAKVLNIYPNSMDGQISLARYLIKIKNVEKAKIVLTDLNSKYPEQDRILFLLGVCEHELNNIEQSFEWLDRSLKINPENAEALIIRGLNSQKINLLDDAFDDLSKASKIKDHLQTKLYPTLGELGLKLSKFEDADNIYKRLIVANRTNGLFWSRRAYANFRMGFYRKALRAFKVSLSLDSKGADLYNLGGGIYRSLHKYNDAVKFYVKALSENPNNLESLNNIALTYRAMGAQDKALEILKHAHSRHPESAEVLTNLGNVHKDLGNFEESENFLKRALTKRPDLEGIYENLAELYETYNKLNELKNLLETGKLKLGSLNADLLLYQSIYLARTGKVVDALKCVNSISEHSISTTRQTKFHFQKAKYAAANGQYELSFKSFDRMNEIKREHHLFNKKAAEVYVTAQTKQLQLLKKNTYLKQNGGTLNGRKINFLVGFPRSGTTLLDNILSSHSRVVVFEELPAVHSAKKLLLADGSYDFITSFPDIKKCNEARNHYFEVLFNGRTFDANEVLIDKLPLNIFELPIISYLFPDAKIIFAVRHPLDAVLSAWQQDFHLNPAMANLTELKSTAILYDLAMSTFFSTRQSRGLSSVIVKYENVVKNLKSEIQDVLNLLNLNWENNLNQYYTTALQKGRITTPSYTQVTQPLYEDSMYKHRHYLKQLEPYNVMLSKWIDEFGYS